MILTIFMTYCAWVVSAYPAAYHTEPINQRNRIITPTRQELQEFFEFLQQLNMRESDTDRESDGGLSRFYLPSQDDEDIGLYPQNDDETVDQPEYFDYPRYIPYMPLKKRSSYQRLSYDDYDEVVPETYRVMSQPQIYPVEVPEVFEEERHPDALRQLESLLSDKRHNSDDSVRQLHSLLNSKAKRSAPAPVTTSTPAPVPAKQNKTGNSIVVTVYESEQAAHEKAEVSKDGQKEIALLRPATPKHRVEEPEEPDYQETEVEVEPQMRQTAEADRSTEETDSQENSEEISPEGIEFSSRLRKRYVTPTDSLTNELHGLKHE